MRRLFYSSGNVLTADPTCKAVLRYARALAESDTADVISIPVVSDDGVRSTAHFLIGPASQLYSVAVAPAGEEPIDQGVLAELEARTLRLHPSRPPWAEEMTDVPDLGLDL